MTNSTSKATTFHAKIKASVSREVKLDDYNRVLDAGESRILGDIEITADSIENLKKKLHAHIDLLE